MWDRFSKDAKIVVVRAQVEAKRLRQKFLEPEHLLLAIPHASECTAYKILERMGANLATLAKLVEQGQTQGEPSGEYAAQFSARSREVFELAYEELRRNDEETIGSEHLLLGVYKERGDGSRILRSQGVYLGELRAALRAYEEESNWEHAAEKPEPKQRPQIHVADFIERETAKFMIWKRLTDEAVGVLVRAQQEARRLGEKQVEPDHVLLAIAQTPDCAGYAVLKRAGLDPATFPALIEKEQSPALTQQTQFPRLSTLTVHVLRLANSEAVHLGRNTMGSEHLLLGIARQRDIAPRLLRSMGVLPDNIVGYIGGQV